MNSTTASDDIGARIAQRLASSLGPRRYAMWFDQSARFDYREQQGDRMLDVAVPNRFVADWIGRHFQAQLRDAADRELGESVALNVRVAPEHFNGDPPQPDATDHGGADTDAHGGSGADAHDSRPRRPAPTPAPSAATEPRTDATRQLRHRLEEFVVGPSNQLAYAAAQRLADDEPDAASPLFVHGGCGLGKTHLLQGLCRRVLEHRPHARVLYTTGERFTNEYITAVRANKLEAFRKWIRRLDLLAVDDVHFIANKQATQQEFLHTFDQIELSGARVVLASDSHPKLIAQFSEALVSRCVRGLVVPIKPPDAKTRTRLVQVLAERRSLHLSPPAARMLGVQHHSSVREIEGALAKLQALVALARQSGQRVPEPIGQALVQQLLDVDAAHRRPHTPVRFETILDAVTAELGVTPQQVLGRGRQHLVVLARALTIHLARQLTTMSYPEIAAALDRGNHSTVITADARIKRQLECDTPIALPPHLDGETLPELAQRLARQIRE